jgi:molybdopterin/thiamine biosynthesis adenylyltransferase
MNEANVNFRHLFFNLRLEADRDAFHRLIETDGKLEVFDQFPLQISELIETRDPRRRFCEEDLAVEVQEWLGGHEAKELGTWVYYPWSHRLVHLLDEADFVELRTNRNRYKITLEEQNLLATKRIGIVGLSVGQSVSLTLAMERGFGELRLTDFDHLGLSNLNRLRSGVHNIGVMKTEITARGIAEIDPYLNVKCFPEGLSGQTMDRFFLEGGKLDLLIDECDDLTIKILMRRRARDLGIPVVMETSDRGMIDIERFDLRPDLPIFHGLIDDLDPEKLRGLSTEDKVPYVLEIVGDKTISSRMIASMIEVGQTIKTWPQLASAVVLGGGVTADVVRRILLGQLSCSGRYFVDLEEIISDSKPSEIAGKRLSVLETISGSQVALENVWSGSPSADRHKIHRIIEAATAAPSGGNNQPWAWMFEKGRLELRHDRERSTSFLDFQDTAAMVALGAAVENAVLGAHAEGWGVRVQPFPRSDDPRLAAHLEFVTRSASNVESGGFDSLHRYIHQRETVRQFGTRKSLSQTILSEVIRAGQSIPGARLQLLTDDEQLQAIGQILGSGDRVRFLNKQLHAELMSEIRWTSEEAQKTRDGIDIQTLELSPSDRAGIQLCRSWSAMQFVSRIGGGAVLERGSRKAIDGACAVGLLTMPKSSLIDFFQGGRCLQRVWLTATACGIGLQPMSCLPYLFARVVRGKGVGLPESQIRELTRLREQYVEMFDLTDETAEVLLFRLVDAKGSVVRALRRPVSEVLTFKA